MQASAYTDEHEGPVTEQRRLRHVCEILVRNLSIPASFEEGAALPYGVRPSLVRNWHSSSSGRPTSPVAGSSSSGPLSSSIVKRPPNAQRRSRDDLDLHIPALHRKNTARRKRTISGGGSRSNGAAQAGGSSSGYLAASDAIDDKARKAGVASSERQFEASPLVASSSMTATHNALDIKGKGKAREGTQPDSHLESIQETSFSSLAEVEVDDSEVVFGWTSSANTPVPLQRSKSRSSLKSASSKRSISSTVSKHLFRSHRYGKGRRKRHSDDEDDEGTSDSEGSGGTSPAKGNANDGRASSPISHHVSFQMSSEPPPAFSSALGLVENRNELVARRARSASRGSIFSVASGSSASTVRPYTVKTSERQERLLRQRRYENVRAHLVRSRLSLAVKDATSGSDSVKEVQALSRLRTHSLPLAREAATAHRPLSPGKRLSEALIYMSPPHNKSMDPSFLLETSNVTCSQERLTDARRQHFLVVRVWVEMPRQIVPPPGESTEDDGREHWTLLLEWEVDLRKLVSLGTDPKLFPRNFPANTLIFKLSNTNEYYTARLPAFMLADNLDEGDLVERDHFRYESEAEEDDGNVSDPGPTTSVAGTRRSQHSRIALVRDVSRDKERLLARRRMILDRSARETRMLQGADDMELKAAVEAELDYLSFRVDILETQNEVDRTLGSSAFLDERAFNRHILVVKAYESDLERLRRVVSAATTSRQDRRRKLEDRRRRLTEARQILLDRRKKLVQAHENHQLDVAVYTSIRLSISQRRAGLISELSTIFPVDLFDAANVLFSICDLPLPNGDFEAQQQTQRSQGVTIDDDGVSAALGYVAQAVQLLAAYLTVPLYYPLRCMGSRSLVQDPISQMKGPKIFPLYSRGVDRYRFEYAVFLLNKDIEQIMLEFGLGIMDLAHTLPNLKSIYLTLSSDATIRSREQQAPKTSTITILQSESKGKQAASEGMNGNVHHESQPSENSLGNITANGDISTASDSMTSTINALEKLLGSTWTAKGQPGTKESSTKPKRRHAEASKTMTLLGGRSSSSVSH